MRRWVVVCVVLLVGAACGGSGPDDELASAVAATADEPFRFTLGARADGTALDQLGDGALETSRFLEGAGLAGTRTPDGRLRVALQLGGDAPLLEVVTGPGEALLLRTGLAEVLGVDDRDPVADLGPALEARGVSPAGRDALTTSFAGGWVALTDVADLGQLLDVAGGSPQDVDEPAGPAGRGDLGALLEEVTVLGADDVGEVRRLEVEVPARSLFAPFGIDGGDVRLPGTVDLRDGRVYEVRFQLDGVALGGSARGATDGDPTSADPAAPPTGDDDPTGTLELVLRIDPVDEVEAVPRPEAGASLTARELVDLVDQLEVAWP